MMEWLLSEQEALTVAGLPGADRYAYLIAKVVEHGGIWSLWQATGWVLAIDGERTLIPVWPHARFAAAAANGAWAGCEPRSIALDSWLEQWLPGIEEQGRAVAAFPTEGESGHLIEPSSMARDFDQEFSKY